jgi:hypothetical protein
MIRDFKESDLENFEDNGLTVGIDRKELLLTLEKGNVWTLEDNGKVRIIIAIIEYAKRCYYGLIYGAKDLNKYDVMKLKKFMNKKCYELRMIRLETTSIDKDYINKYHRFLGYKEEGVKRNYYGDGVDYKMWSILWE